MAGRKAAVLGSPVSHSRSPDLHLAAYRALGLSDWTYDRIEVTADRFAEVIDRMGPEWVGLSVTMPNKSAALAYADQCTSRALAIESANTLVRTDSGWRADCTDIDGVTGALTELGVVGDETRPPSNAVVLGAGGTAGPALAALSAAGCRHVAIVAREQQRAAGTLGTAERLGMDATFVPFESSATLADHVRSSSVVVSTVPADAAATLVDTVAAAPALLDVIYHPWPTPLASAVTEVGGRVVGGLVMLLNQAYGQVEQFTGRPAPRAAMAAVLTGEQHT